MRSTTRRRQSFRLVISQLIQNGILISFHDAIQNINAIIKARQNLFSDYHCHSGRYPECRPYIAIKQFLCCYIKYQVRMSCGKLLNPHFIGVICFITFNYFVYAYEYMISLKQNNYLILLIIFHVLFALLLWSMIRAIVGDPGRVPIYWGFFAEESENRKRRYCLLCHSFKPERCHHCSTCQRCVLNMDHHCPWIANCVGFTNRKFFMLFLFYVIMTLIYCLACEIPILIGQVIDIIKGTTQFSIPFVIRAIGTLIQSAFFVVISIFFKFHVQLVLSNSTTLDNLERQRNPNAGPNVYDIGSYQNFEQVFGSNWLLWLIPVSPTSSNKANGVVWPKNQ